jgi:plasmid stabilization system protein ParE
MRLPIRFLPEAEEEVIDTARWYDGQRPGLGDEFLARLDNLLDAIDSRPESFQQVFQDIRRAVMRRFPYCIYFRIREHDLTVIAVLHGRRNPAAWRSRIF